MSRIKTLLLIAGVFLLLLIVLSIIFQKNKGIKVETDFAKRGQIVSYISAPGNIQPVTKVQVSSDVSGRVTQLPVKEGQMVTKGQFLAQIDSSSYQAQVNQSKANLAQAQASLIQSQAQWRRTRILYKSKLISAQEMESSRAQYQLDLARKQQAQAQLDQALSDLDDTTIKAPISGTIIRLDVELGEVVVPGTTNIIGTVMMIIADLSKMRVECDVDEADISSVRTGEKTKIEIDAYPDSLFYGTVSEVGNAQNSEDQTSSSQQSTGGTNATASNISVTYTVKIEFDRHNVALKPDMTVNVEIITASKDNALIIPVQAIIPQLANTNDTNNQSKTYAVYTINKNRAHFQPVTTGIFGEDYAEITNGINEGQEIITGPFSNLNLLKEGVRIQVIKPEKDSSKT